MAGCVVVGVDADGLEEVERVGRKQLPEFWGHYRVGPDGLQVWLADYEDRDAAIEAMHRGAGRAPTFVEIEGELVRIGIGTRETRDPHEDPGDLRAAAAAVAEYERDGGVGAEEALQRYPAKSAG